ncbi:hypothetical protein BHM03_00054308 [Ensete ventricosum]|nr:hypothetical protein BHM03_00054308 [Ensete ventricosum]
MSDVYSFGIVLLELLTGRKSVDKTRPVRQQALADWAAPLLSQRKRVLNIVDPRLGGEYPVKAVQKMAMLVHHCLNRNPKARPLMRDIVDSLEPLQESVEFPSIGFIYTVRINHGLLRKIDFEGLGVAHQLDFIMVEGLGLICSLLNCSNRARACVGLQLLNLLSKTISFIVHSNAHPNDMIVPVVHSGRALHNSLTDFNLALGVDASSTRLVGPLPLAA